MVYYNPQECFIAIKDPGPALTDVVVSSTITTQNIMYGMVQTETPDFIQAPFTPLLGQASHGEG